ncbi:MAG: hypothetical protein Q8R24_00180 [Legionellaceae bacterium]|nr:hypothetical protein [Legionellaceae bacterium]
MNDIKTTEQGTPELDDSRRSDSGLLSATPTLSNPWNEIFIRHTYTSLSDDAQKEVDTHLQKLFGMQDTEALPRFNDDAVNVIFEKRSSRKEALTNCDKLLKKSIPAKIRYMDAAQANALEQELRIALYQYLAQYQAITDHIGVIRSQYTEKAKCYEQIKRCGLLLGQAELRKLRLKLEKLELANALERLNSETQINSCFEEERTQLLHEIDEKESDLNVPAQYLKAAKPPPDTGFIPIFLKESDDVQDSDYIIFQMSMTNGRRLCWVWNRCFIESILPFAHEQLLTSTIIAAYVSWTLYWIRGGVVAYGGLEHAFDSWVSKEEQVIDEERRRKAHWNERRDDILNDLIWGASNFACCFWLVGPGAVGFAGDLLTGVLLCMDLALAALRYRDGITDHNLKMRDYNDQLKSVLTELKKIEKESIHDQKIKASVLKLQKQMAELESEEQKLEQQRKEQWLAPDMSHLIALKQSVMSEMENMDSILRNMNIQTRRDHPVDIEQLDVLVRKFTVVHWAKEDCKNRWDDKYVALLYDVAYAVALLVAFVMMCGFYLHGIALPVAVSIIGAAMLTVSTIVWRSAVARLEYGAIERTAESNETEYAKLMDKFIALGEEYQKELEKSQTNLIDDTRTQLLNKYDRQRIDYQMKQLYLDMLQLGATSGEQYEQVHFKIIELLRATLLRLLVPAAIILTLMFAPVSIFAVPSYVFLMLGVLVLAVASSYGIEKICKPKKTAWQQTDIEPVDSGEVIATDSQPELIEGEYEAFKRSVLVFKKDSKVVLMDNPFGVFSEPKGMSLLPEIQKNRKGNNHHLFRTLHEVSVKSVDKRVAIEIHMGESDPLLGISN